MKLFYFGKSKKLKKCNFIFSKICVCIVIDYADMVSALSLTTTMLTPCLSNLWFRGHDAGIVVDYQTWCQRSSWLHGHRHKTKSLIAENILNFLVNICLQVVCWFCTNKMGSDSPFYFSLKMDTSILLVAKFFYIFTWHEQKSSESKHFFCKRIFFLLCLCIGQWQEV